MWGDHTPILGVPRLNRYYLDKPVGRKGEYAIYFGELTRTKIKAGRQTVINIIHCFLIGGRRYVCETDAFEPCEMALAQSEERE